MTKSEITAYKKSIKESEKHLIHFAIDRSEWKRGKKILDNEVIHKEPKNKAENIIKILIPNDEIKKLDTDGKDMGDVSHLAKRKGTKPFSFEKTIEANEILTLLWGDADMKAEAKAKELEKAKAKEIK